MSMDEMLLQELYGSQQAQADEQTKQAQIELVQAVAAESGINLEELDDDELSKFAHYVLSNDDETGYVDNELQDKLAEADLVGRQMALSYADQLTQINEETPMFDKVAHAMNDVAEAWMAEKIATSGASATSPVEAVADSGPGFMTRMRNRAAAAKEGIGARYGAAKAHLANASLGRKIGYGVGAAGVAGGLGYGAYRMLRKKQEKKAALMYEFADISPEEFAKEAELRAAEILIENGIDPQTLEAVQPEYVKIASFPTPEEAEDEAEYEVFEHYNGMLDTAAHHIIDALLS